MESTEEYEEELLYNFGDPCDSSDRSSGMTTPDTDQDFEVISPGKRYRLFLAGPAESIFDAGPAESIFDAGPLEPRFDGASSSRRPEDFACRFVKDGDLEISLQMAMRVLEQTGQEMGEIYGHEITTTAPEMTSKIGYVAMLKLIPELDHAMENVIEEEIAKVSRGPTVTSLQEQPLQEIGKVCGGAAVTSLHEQPLQEIGKVSGGAAVTLLHEQPPSERSKTSLQADLPLAMEDIQKWMQDREQKGEELDFNDLCRLYKIGSLNVFPGSEENNRAENKQPAEEEIVETHQAERASDGGIMHSLEDDICAPSAKDQKGHIGVPFISSNTVNEASNLDSSLSMKQISPSARKAEEQSTADSHGQAAIGSEKSEKAVSKELVEVRELPEGCMEHEEEKSTVTHPATPPGPSEKSIVRQEPERPSRRTKMEERFFFSIDNRFLCVCKECGVLHNTDKQEYTCRICSDESRNSSILNFTWLSHHDCILMNVTNKFVELDPGRAYQITTWPRLFKNDGAIFLRLPHGNILWDCVSFVDEIIVSKIAKVGGIAAIVLSCPEKMGACARLSYIFNRCPVYVHENDRRIYRRFKNLRRAKRIWTGDMIKLWDGVTIHCLGGHYPGSCILHFLYRGGVVFPSDTLKIVQGRRSVSVMKSYGNYIPASPRDVKKILDVMDSMDFEEIWGEQPGVEIIRQAKPMVISSLRRYILWSQHDEIVIPLSRREIIARGKRKTLET
ncbi:hypothetical protein MPTK2_8g18810 [Marchantia polymorpha subsp. ruderalis]